MKIGEEIGVFGLGFLGYTNLWINGLWWMIIVFDGWIEFGVKFIVDLV